MKRKIESFNFSCKPARVRYSRALHTPLVNSRSVFGFKMAPVTGIDDDQRFALMAFRKSVKDVMKPEHDDHFLLRWLRARQWNAEAAEKMLRDSLAWREKWGVDTIKTWKGSEVLEKYFPSGTPGFDKEGSPIIVIPFKGLDIYGLLHCATKTDILKMVIKDLEKYLESGRQQAEKHGSVAMKVTVIFDMENFNLRQYAWRPAAELVVSLLKIYEANYPEILKTCFIINVPRAFSLAFNVVKKFMHEYTISKIKIFGTDEKKWQPELLKIIDASVLPKHFGGNAVDANGDPRCGLLIKPGGKIPKTSYTGKTSVEPEKKEYTNVTIKSGDKLSVPLLCADPDSVLKWEFGVESQDINFQINCIDEEGKESVIHGPVSVSEGDIDAGFLNVNGPATYSLLFENSGKTKKVFYEAFISNPNKELNISDSLEENTAL